jgi:hypothetical protein
MLRPLALFGAVSMFLLMSGCGGDEQEASPPSAPVECVSTTKDAHDLGLRGARLRIVGDEIEVTWTTAGPVRSTPGGSFDVELVDESGNRRGGLSLTLWDGELASIFGDYDASVHGLRFLDSEPVDGPPEIAGRSITMFFPRSAIEDRVGQVAQWRAAAGAHVKGEDWDDWCPDPRPGEEKPEPLPLPAPG